MRKGLSGRLNGIKLTLKNIRQIKTKKRMKDKTVLLTGASRGIGLAIKRILEKENYVIVAPSRQELNLADRNSVSCYIAKNKNLNIDILINNAGINNPQWIQNLDDKNIDETIEVNLISPIKLIRTYVGHMMQNRWGRIVNISSIFGIVARGKQVLYSATKHGLNGVTKALALELGPYNILVNSVCPGFTNTDLVKRNSSEKNAALAKDIPLGRFAEASEIAQVVLFLISDENSYMNGANIVLDGGFTCR